MATTLATETLECPADVTLWHDAFYRFIKVEDPEALVAQLQTVCVAAAVLGNIIVATEGVNGMLAGTEDALQQVRDTFEADSRFAGMLYKRTRTSKMPFRRLRIRTRAEIVPLGLEGVDGSKTGIDVPPEQWRELIQQDDVVLIDNRNSFEYKLGHFEGAIDPGVRNFRHFKDYVEDHKEAWQDKRVAMYCTGGIRCEKTSAWMRDLGYEVYQLEGGILNYFAKMPDAEKDYTGECFVFDWRVSLNTKLEETDTTLHDVEDQGLDGVG